MRWFVWFFCCLVEVWEIICSESFVIWFFGWYLVINLWLLLMIILIFLIVKLVFVILVVRMIFFFFCFKGLSVCCCLVSGRFLYSSIMFILFDKEVFNCCWSCKICFIVGRKINILLGLCVVIMCMCFVRLFINLWCWYLFR